MKGKGEGREIWGHHRHDRSAQIHLLGSWHCHTTFCSHWSKCHRSAHRAGEKAPCHFFQHCQSSESTLNVKATYFRSSMRKRKLFHCFSKRIETIMNIHLHFSMPLKKFQQSKHNWNINLQICRFNLSPIYERAIFLTVLGFFLIPGSTLTVIYFSLWTGRRYEFKLQSGDLK